MFDISGDDACSSFVVFWLTHIVLGTLSTCLLHTYFETYPYCNYHVVMFKKSCQAILLSTMVTVVVT